MADRPNTPIPEESEAIRLRAEEQAAARREVTLRTTGRVLNVFSEKPAYLRSIELLDAVVGPKPAGSWRDRWPELQYAKFLRVDESWAGLQHRETVIQFFRTTCA